MSVVSVFQQEDETMNPETKAAINGFLDELRERLYEAASSGVDDALQLTRIVEELACPPVEGFVRTEAGCLLFVARVGPIDLSRIPMKHPVVGGYRKMLMEQRSLTPREVKVSEEAPPAEGLPAYDATLPASDEEPDDAEGSSPRP